MTVRDEVRVFCEFGPLPSEEDDSEEGDEAFEQLELALHAIEKPVTDEEARLLVGSFGVDECFGLAWTLLHLVESAPSPVFTTEPPPGSNEWIIRLWRRYRNTLADQ
ncbi:hypothetical protein [Micromonospora aurantiaca (nom. illeg.)]|uniref:hypothetical protein n=1 Tax=Micromonospora aurantiaca (nom. illeg.) TaxID=47850 RepID=UPI003EB9FCBA